MYQDTIKVANKIISTEDLTEIFAQMNASNETLSRICQAETEQNANIPYENQVWTIKKFQGEFKCTFDFYDDTTITVDNYAEFSAIFQARLREIKHIWARCTQFYSTGPNSDMKHIGQHIYITLYENKMEIDASLSSEDKNLNEVYELIKSKVLNAPEKYDKVVKNKALLLNKIYFAGGAIPGVIFCTLLALIPIVRKFYDITYILFPLLALISAYFIGTLRFSRRLARLYATISPEQKYAGYDTNAGKSIYKDDIDQFVSTGEIIIGKNIDNLKNRQEILDLAAQASRPILPALLVILIISALIIIIF